MQPRLRRPLVVDLSPSYDDPESSSCPKPGSALSRPAGVTSRGVARSRALFFVSLIAWRHTSGTIRALGLLFVTTDTKTFTVLSRRGFSSKRLTQ